MKILVTGTDGFIGHAVASHLVNAGHQVEGWTYVPNKYPDPSQCDRVIHCGAISSTTETDVEKIMVQNTDFTMKLIELCDMMGTSLQYSSTANLYGNTDNFNEDAPLHPESPYGWSKYLVDRFVQSYIKDFKINIQGFRYFNVYGEFEHIKGDQASPVTKFTKEILDTGKLKLFEGSDKFFRDFICVDDIIDIVLNNDKGSGIYDLGTSNPVSFQNVAECVAEKYDGEIEYVPFPDHLKGKYQTYTCAKKEWGDYKFMTVQDYLTAS